MNFYIEMINVGVGESYILNFIKESKVARILIDGGSEKGSTNLENIMNKIKPSQEEDNDFNKINGIIVTHIDDDHIGGILKLLNLQNIEDYIDLKQDFFIMFNDFVDPSTIKYTQGIQLKRIIDKYPTITLVHSYRQNEIFKINGFEVCIQNCIQNSNLLKPIAHKENVILIDIILPAKETIVKLMKAWLSEKKNPNLVNESSIVFTLEYNRKKILLSSDNYYSKILEQLLNFKRKNIEFDLIKIAHHGAKENNYRISELINQNKRIKIMVPIYKKSKFIAFKSTLKEILKYDKSIICFPREAEEYQDQIENLETYANEGRILFEDTIKIL